MSGGDVQAAPKRAETGGGTARTIGLWGATGVGVGAIVGGGIMVLAGVAFSSAGPAAMVAFAVNGVVAFITAMSYAEIATSFPESGGTYTFAKKVLSVRAAFGVGWILWFAYIVAGVLYALGFAAYATLALRELIHVFGGTPPSWLAGHNFTMLLATLATGLYALGLVRKASGGGQWATIGKVVVFAVIILVGVIALFTEPVEHMTSALDPFFDGGFTGLVAASGFTFIAAQGFDLIPAIGGEIKDPRRNIPRAMYMSLAIAMAVYLPLLFVVSTAGVGDDVHIRQLAVEHGDTVFAVVVKRFMGTVGYWLIIVAAILSTLSALLANLLAASRVALAMARDRTLPRVFSRVHARRRTPVMAIYASALTLVAILFMVPDLGAAGAAASLIFLVTFLLAHITAYLARVRGGEREDSYRTPWFPLIPAAGALACGGLAVFQTIEVPDAARVALVWLGLGVILYVALFKSGAETADARAEGLDPELAVLRGKSPLVLLPIANPAHARGMVDVANALAPSQFARVLLLTVVEKPRDPDADPLAKLGEAQKVVGEALGASYAAGHTPQALITASADPWAEIRRVAELYDCESLIIGLGVIAADGKLEGNVERLLNDVDCDVAVMRSSPGWSLGSAKRILVPMGGRGEEHGLRARVLSSICRDSTREVSFVRVLPADADEDAAEALRAISQLAEVKVRGRPRVEVIRHDDPVRALLDLCAEHDLVVLGLHRSTWGKRGFGSFALRIAGEAACPAILLSRRPSQIVSDVYRPIERVVAAATPWMPRKPPPRA